MGLRAALAERAPSTKEDLWHYCKEVMQFRCESCEGHGRYTGPRGTVTCPRCYGEGRVGLHFGRVAVCPTHSAPFDVLWELYSATVEHMLVVANRGGGKTRLLTVFEHLLMKHRYYSVLHMGGIQAQAERARNYFHRQVADSPWREDVEGEQPGQESAVFMNGARIEWLPGTLRQASGGHPELSVLDEVDEADPTVRKRFASTPQGPRAQFVEGSTWYKQEGTISLIRKEARENGITIPTRTWCLWESIQRCTYDCNMVPLPDGTTGRCPLFETTEPQPDGTVRTVPLCGGVLARRSDGHITVPEAIKNWLRIDFWTRRVEMLCQEPTVPSGSRAYWAFSPQQSPDGNVLAFDPWPVPNLPIEWTLDFNVNPMSSFVIQQAPAEYGREWWILDELYIPTASTQHVVEEFLRRYGPGGTRLRPEARETGHMGGIWIFGDWTGHARQQATLKSNYDVIRELLGQIHGFRQCVYPTDVAPVVDRLTATNRLLWDLNAPGRPRGLKIAPRCHNGVRELNIMPMKSGTMEKDKGDRMQKQLGLSHLGDALECWTWKRFPRGFDPHGSSAVFVVGERTSAALFTAGKRAAAGKGGPTPWLTDGKERHG